MRGSRYIQTGTEVFPDYPVLGLGTVPPIPLNQVFPGFIHMAFHHGPDQGVDRDKSVFTGAGFRSAFHGSGLKVNV